MYGFPPAAAEIAFRNSPPTANSSGILATARLPWRREKRPVKITNRPIFCRVGYLNSPWMKTLRRFIS